MKWLRNFFDASLRSFDVGVTRYSTLQKLRENASALQDLMLLKSLPREHAAQLLGCFSDSKSQYRQDLFVLSELDFKRDGYFVEFGATNGVDLSNTHLLERRFGWKGILAEPAKCWHQDLRRNRSAYLEEACVWRESGVSLRFSEVEYAELSTIGVFRGSDRYGRARSRAKTYDVTTISLNDLLEKFNAPQRIDYLSIDTEGSEYEILRGFNFDRRRFSVITCEHNFTPAREKLYELLTQKGYVRKHENLSQFDDWYVSLV